MKRYIITLILLITCTFTLTGCRNQTTDSGFKGNVEIAWDDVKDDFDQIDQDVENDTFMVKPPLQKIFSFASFSQIFKVLICALYRLLF